MDIFNLSQEEKKRLQVSVVDEYELTFDVYGDLVRFSKEGRNKVTIHWGESPEDDWPPVSVTQKLYSFGLSKDQLQLLTNWLSLTLKEDKNGI